MPEIAKDEPRQGIEPWTYRSLRIQTSKSVALPLRYQGDLLEISFCPIEAVEHLGGRFRSHLLGTSSPSRSEGSRDLYCDHRFVLRHWLSVLSKASDTSCTSAIHSVMSGRT